jgi:transcriptional regulator with XRE-family HTH domain
MTLMTEPVSSLQDDNRKQLGAFLRARRESLDPQRLGLPRSGRRRTPGLRREEVAMLADVGVTWYTWLEQGRDVNPSSAVMLAVAKALQCTATETRHLFVLAGLPTGEVPQQVPCEGISEGTRRLLDTLMPKPASIQKPNFDIVAWNDSFGHLMGVDFNEIPAEDRNCIYLFLTHPAWRSRLGKRADALPISARQWRSIAANHCGKPSWHDFLRSQKSSKRCGIRAMTCVVLKIS